MKTRFKPKFNIRKGDKVVVIAGDDKDMKQTTHCKKSIGGSKPSDSRRCEHRYQT